MYTVSVSNESFFSFPTHRHCSTPTQWENGRFTTANWISWFSSWTQLLVGRPATRTHTQTMLMMPLELIAWRQFSFSKDFQRFPKISKDFQRKQSRKEATDRTNGNGLFAGTCYLYIGVKSKDSRWIEYNYYPNPWQMSGRDWMLHLTAWKWKREK